MDEARNASHFGHAESVRGLAMCAALTIGTLMGGRRPRTLTAIRLRNLYFKWDVSCLMEFLCVSMREHHIYRGKGR